MLLAAPPHRILPYDHRNDRRWSSPADRHYWSTLRAKSTITVSGCTTYCSSIVPPTPSPPANDTSTWPQGCPLNIRCGGCLHISPSGGCRWPFPSLRSWFMLDDSGRGPWIGTLYTLKKYSKYHKRTSNRYFKYLIAKRYLGEALRRNSTRRENVHKYTCSSLDIDHLSGEVW